jgi:glutamyl-tRNA synthetase
MDDATIRAYVLANAVKYDGRAAAGAIIGQLIAQDPSVKDRMKEVGTRINEIVKEVNKLGLEKQTAELAKLKPELLAPKPKEERKRELPMLVSAEKGKVVTRFPPEPGKLLHLGHAAVILLNEMEARQWQGKFIFRYEETDPEKEYDQEVIEGMRDDMRWLGVKPDKEVFASDYMSVYYEKAERLIKQKDAYVCFCNQETMRDLRFKGIPCAHRDASVEQNLEDWKKMLTTAKQGECVLRLKGDMENPNGTLRDPVLMRIITAPHFRHGKKYRVWPLYDFESPIAEDICGTTHILRSAEFDQRIELQDLIKQKLDLRAQEVITFGRINVMGSTTSGREMREKIAKGEYIGWDDPRLVTLKTLRRRGIQPKALRELVAELGWDKGQVNLDYSIVAAINRKILDEATPRRFFVPSPVAIIVEGAPAKEVHLPVHPQNPSLGTRTLRVREGQKVLIGLDDSKRKDKLLRLMDYCNFVRKGKGFAYDSPDIESFRERGGAIVHWLPDDYTAPAEVMMPDATVLKGVVEPSVKELKIGSVVQFERFGFCRFDAVEGKGEKAVYKFWFCHK